MVVGRINKILSFFNKCSGPNSKVNIEKMSERSRSAENTRSIFEPHMREAAYFYLGLSSLFVSK